MSTITLSHGGKFYAHSVAEDGAITCDGCGKKAKNFRGLMSHQNHRNADAACKPSVEPVADDGADTSTGYSTEAELDEAYDAREESRQNYLDSEFGDDPYERQKADARSFKDLDDWYGAEKAKLDAKLAAAPTSFLDGVPASAEDDLAQDEIDAEDYSDARLVAALEEHMAEEAAARFELPDEDDEDAAVAVQNAGA